jgi:hypothetical protein
VDRLWGDLTPLSSSDFGQSFGERRLLVGVNASQAQLGKSIAESLLETGDSLVVSGPQSPRRDFEPSESNAAGQPIFNQNNDYFRKLEASHSSSPSSSTSTSTSTAITVRNEQSTITSRPGFYRVTRTTGTVGLINLCVYDNDTSTFPLTPYPSEEILAL